ncbi:MAG: L-fucose/L-arabinose isomerase family protein [Bacteroidales bacterium]|nr:L-fucose/L-arabinose isomerase family protein [Bacteroidales bacterium]
MVKIGLFGIGLDTYWPQFDGLLNKLKAYHSEIKNRLVSFQVDIVDAGIVDNPEKAGAAAKKFISEDVELIFLNISTYALSSTVLAVVQKMKVPVIVLNLQPVATIDYKAFNAINDRGKMTGEWLAHCQACTVPEIASVFNRSGIDFFLVTGYLQDPIAWTEIENWVDAVKVRIVMRENRVGIIGNYYGGMLDVYSDLTQQSAVFGNHFEIIEVGELKQIRDAVVNNAIEKKVKQFHMEFEVSPECERVEIDRAARTSCALDEMVKLKDLGAIAYFFEGKGDPDYENIATSIIAGNTLLTGHNVPVAGEYEVKNVQAMKILDAFGIGGSFSEFYLMDFEDDVVLLGHDGPAHPAIAEGSVGLVPLPIYHGKPGKGLSIQMTVKHGPVTVLSVVQDGNGKLSLLVAEGKSVPGPVLNIGNTNSRYRFSIGARTFVDEWSKAGPAHHCAIGVGHIANKIDKLGALLGIEVRKIC